MKLSKSENYGKIPPTMSVVICIYAISIFVVTLIIQHVLFSDLHLVQ